MLEIVSFDRPLSIASLNGLEIEANTVTPLSHVLAGNPRRFVRMAREIGPDPRIRWTINTSIVGVFAEMELFGTKVCVSHVHDALEAWQRGQRLPGGYL